MANLLFYRDQVKAAMVDSAQQAVSQLKAELSDLQQEVEEARRAADDGMAAASRATESAARETEALRWACLCLCELWHITGMQEHCMQHVHVALFVVGGISYAWGCGQALDGVSRCMCVWSL